MESVKTKNGMFIGILEENKKSKYKSLTYEEYLELNNIKSSGFIDPRIYRDYKRNCTIKIKDYFDYKFRPYIPVRYELQKANKITKSFLNKNLKFGNNSRYGIKKKDVIDFVYEFLKTGETAPVPAHNGCDSERNWIVYSSGSYCEGSSMSRSGEIRIHKYLPIVVYLNYESEGLIGRNRIFRKIYKGYYFTGLPKRKVQEELQIEEEGNIWD